MMNRLIGRPALQLMARRFKYTHNYDEMVNANKVVVFMKGTPDQPQCGFSRGAIQILEVSGVDFDQVNTHNILADEAMRAEMKDYSDWPTFPQIYLDGEFYAGLDIMYEDYQNDKLEGILKEAGVKLV